MSKIKIILWSVLLLGLANPVWCRGALPDYYPSSFKNEGILQEFEDGGRTLIINATAYRIGRNVIVHTLKSEFGSINSLHVNMDVAFQLEGKQRISEIWILPKGSVELD